MAVEQGSITVTKTWAAGQEPNEVVEVCFEVTADEAGTEILGEACTSDDTYTVTFGPSEPPLQTGVTYYVRERTGDGWMVTGDNPVAVVIPDTTGETAVAFENRRDGAAVEVREFACPPGFESDDPDAWHEACQGSPRPGVELSLSGPDDLFLEGSTDANGELVFPGLLVAGEYTLAEQVPTGDFVDFVVACERLDTGEEIAIDYRSNGRAAVAFDLTDAHIDADVTVRCEWYNVPAAEPGDAASLTIHKSTCPDDVAPERRFDECHANGLTGVEFVLDGPVSGSQTTAGPIGAVNWTDLPAGTYTVAEAVPSGDFIDYVVFCSNLATGAEVPLDYSSNGRAAIVIDIADGDQVVCDWYNIAASEPAELDFRIAAFNCPEDPGNVSLAAGNIPGTCDPAEGAAFTVTDANGTLLAECTAEANGLCIVQLPMDIAVTVTEDEATISGNFVPRQNPIQTEVRTEFAGALFINLPGDQPTVMPTSPTLAIDPTTGTGGDTIRFSGRHYTPGGDVSILMTGDGLIVAEVQADADGEIEGSFTAPERDRLTGESTDDIPVFAIDEASGQESARVTFTYLTVTPPVEGRPVHVHGGVCADLASSPRYPLTDLAVPAGSPAGAPEAAVAEVSFTVIDVSLDELLAESHAINAHLSQEDMSVYVACGEIGGPRGADGSIAVGLREQNGSGLTGIAYLIPDANDPARTRVTVFMAGGLAEEDPTLQPVSADSVLIHSVVNNGPISPEFQTGYEITIYGDGRVEIMITPEGSSPAVAESDRTAEQETVTLQLSEDEVTSLLAELHAIGFFTLTRADDVDPEQLLIGGDVSALTVTLVDGAWEINRNGLPSQMAEVLDQAQRIVADAVGGVEVPPSS
jgi:hypothetical protein